MSGPLESGRVPPSDLPAEALVLSACMMSGDLLLEAQELLTVEHWYADANRRIFAACCELQAKGSPADLVQVAGLLRDQGRLEQVGGVQYIAMLANEIPASASVIASCKSIREKYRLRRVIESCQRAEAEAYSGVTDAQAFIEQFEAQVYAISQESLRPETGAHVQDILTRCVDELHRKRKGGQATGKATPFKGLNRMLAGLRPGTVTTVAARPGMGKTSFLTDLLVHGSRDTGERRASVFFSLEMPSEDIGNKLMSQAAQIDSRGIDTGLVSQRELEDLLTAANEIRKLPVIVNDKPSLTLTELRAALRRHERALAPHRLGLVGIDYLQLMGTHDLPRGLSTNDQLEHLMRGLCATAKEFQVPIVLLSQLNRKCEERPDKRPNLGDLRSSGAIEQDSFNIIFLYREDQYRKPGEPKDNSAELIVAKARAGRPGTAHVTFIPKATKYIDKEEPPDEFDEWGGRFDL